MTFEDLNGLPPEAKADLMDDLAAEGRALVAVAEALKQLPAHRRLPVLKAVAALHEIDLSKRP